MLEMKYFVLKPKAKNNSDLYAFASWDAMLAYASRIKNVDPAMATGLELWVCREQDDLIDRTESDQPKEE